MLQDHGMRDEGAGAEPPLSQSVDHWIHGEDRCEDARRAVPGSGMPLAKAALPPFPPFPIPLETRQEFALLPSLPAHHLGLEPGELLLPGAMAGAGDGVHGCTHVAHPCAPSPWHGKHMGCLCRCQAPRKGRVPQPGQGSSRIRPQPAVLGPADPPGAAGRFGHPLLLQINGCAAKKIEAIILRSHPLYPPTSTT